MAHKHALMIGEPEEDLPPRRLMLDDDPLIEERNELLNLSKRALLTKLEACELQNERFQQYLAQYEAIQRSDRAELDRVRREGDALGQRLGELQHRLDVKDANKIGVEDGRYMVTNMVHGLLQLVALLDDKTQAAMVAVKRIEHQIYKTPYAKHWLESRSDMQVAVYQLCKWAAYLPRENANLFRTYELGEMDFVPIAMILERTRL